MDNGLFDIDQLLSGAFEKKSLKELFEAKLDELKLNKTNVLDILEMPTRTLTGLLTGNQKLVDVTNLVKMADFLQIPKEEVFKLYLDSVQIKHPVASTSPEKVKFIKENFELTVLKKAGLIDSLVDFQHIENRINSRLGYRSIFEYAKPRIDVAFSSGLFKPKNQLTRLFWIRTAICTFEELSNPYEYDRASLVKYFPEIRWHSLNENRGLVEVVKALYKLGITVIFMPPLQGLQLRGATFSVNDKPCIVLTNYQGFYSTLWFALVHELYHVLFDWQDIRSNSYHLTDDDNNELTVQEREREADGFAREYLFSNDKLIQIKSKLREAFTVRQFAKEHHVHPSIIYAIYAFDNSDDRKAWARVKANSPAVEPAVSDISYPWNTDQSFDEMIVRKKQLIYN